MTDKEIQLFILRYLEAGNTKADKQILTDIPEKERRQAFIDALTAIENRGFLCPKYRTSDTPELSQAYVSADGRAFLRENTPEPLIEAVGRTTSKWLDRLITALVAALVTTLVNILVTLYLLGKIF